MESCIEKLIDLYNQNVTLQNFHLMKALNQHKSEIKNAYNAGYRDGQNESNLSNLNDIDISQFSNAKDYYFKTFDKKFF